MYKIMLKILIKQLECMVVVAYFSVNQGMEEQLKEQYNHQHNYLLYLDEVYLILPFIYTINKYLVNHYQTFMTMDNQLFIILQHYHIYQINYYFYLIMFLKSVYNPIHLYLHLINQNVRNMNRLI